MDILQFATSFRELIETTEMRLRSLSEEDANRAPATGNWTRKQIVGHLIDSAANNHQRFVRLQLQETLTLPGYAQADWVRVQHYELESWAGVVNLWSAYNRHLAHVIYTMCTKCMGRVWHKEGTEEEYTLEFIAEDYRSHLEHHLGQVFGE
jgi:hypothetical protein